MDGPAFDNWYVICGISGFDFDNYIYDYDNETSTEFRDHIEPGTKLQVYDFYSGKYMLIINDENHKSKGRDIVYVTENEFEELFTEPLKTIDMEIGEKLENEVRCVVTSDIGLVLRQGPARTFQKYLVIPTDAEISYQYVYVYGGLNWGYTTYNGKSGWMCIDYTEIIADEPETNMEQDEIDKAAENITTEAEEENTDEEITDEAAVIISEEPEEQIIITNENVESSPEFFASTTAVIVICCLGALVLALTAVVILLIIKRKKDEQQN